jgi:predicted esterase
MLETHFIPAPQKESTRLLVALHGLGDSMEGYRWVPSALNLPWLNFLLVNAPDAYYGGFSWYDIHDPQKGVLRSIELLHRLYGDLEKKGFPSEQTVVFGFSQGCLMTLESALRYPKRFAALIGVSGYILDPAKLLAEASSEAKSQRILVTHGTRDPLIPFLQVKMQMTELQRAGLKLTWREFDKEHTIAGLEEVQLLRDFIKEALK